jgi:hypothetical protein
MSTHKAWLVLFTTRSAHSTPLIANFFESPLLTSQAMHNTTINMNNLGNREWWFQDSVMRSKFMSSSVFLCRFKSSFKRITSVCKS